jgi:hypothetical protein
MSLVIKFGAEFEIDRIRFTLNKLNWYKSKGYKPILPSEVSFNNIEEVVRREFDKSKYEKVARKIREEFSKVEAGFTKRLEQNFREKIPKNFEVVLTKYGVGGSYKLPNKIILNIAGNQANKSLLDVLKHEIVHLLVEKDVRKQKLSHKGKEKLAEAIEKEV